MKTILITGGHSGLGRAASKELASNPDCDVILAGRSMQPMEECAEQLRAVRKGNVRTLLLDMSSLASIRKAVTGVTLWLERGDVAPLYAIVCNAGGKFDGPVSFSAEGYENTFATNHLGNFLLVNLLLDKVAPNGRVVFTASGTHDPETADGRMVGKAIEPDAVALANEGVNGAKPHSSGIRYSTSKLCTILFAYELDRRLKGASSSIASIAFDPGSIPETGLLRTMPKFVQWLAKTSLMKALMRRMGVTQGSIEFSGASLAKIAVSPDYEGASGKYLQSNDGRLIEQRSSIVSHDKTKAAKLWIDSEKLVRLSATEKSVLLSQNKL